MIQNIWSLKRRSPRLTVFFHLKRWRVAHLRFAAEPGLHLPQTDAARTHTHTDIYGIWFWQHFFLSPRKTGQLTWQSHQACSFQSTNLIAARRCYFPKWYLLGSAKIQSLTKIQQQTSSVFYRWFNWKLAAQTNHGMKPVIKFISEI